jgi:transcription elongation factor Elf1
MEIKGDVVKMTRDDFKLTIVAALVAAGCKSPMTAFNTAEEYAKKADKIDVKFEAPAGTIMNVTNYVDGKTVSCKKPTMQEIGTNVCKSCTLTAKCKEPERSSNLQAMKKLCLDAYERYINS